MKNKENKSKGHLMSLPAPDFDIIPDNDRLLAAFEPTSFGNENDVEKARASNPRGSRGRIGAKTVGRPLTAFQGTGT